MEMFCLNEMCRICWEHKNLQTVFNEEIPSLCEMLTACIPIEVCEENGLPTKLCNKCSDELEKAYLFRVKCIDSDIKLKKYLNEIGINANIQYIPVSSLEVNVIAENVKNYPKHDNKNTVLQNLDEDLSNNKTNVTSAVSEENKDGISQIEEGDLKTEKNKENIIENSIESNYEEVIELSQEDQNDCSRMPTLHKCQICLKSYTHRKNLKRHLKEYHFGKLRSTQTGSRDLRCSICKNIFSYRNALVRHLRVLHKDITQTCFRFKNGKRYCTSKISIFIEKANEITTQVKGILGDIENNPKSIESDDENKKENGLLLVENNPNNLIVEGQNINSYLSTENVGIVYSDEENTINITSEVILENVNNILSDNEHVQIVEGDDCQTVYVVDENIFSKIAEMALVKDPDIMSTPTEKKNSIVKCDLCDRDFESKPALKEHLKTVHKLTEDEDNNISFSYDNDNNNLSSVATSDNESSEDFKKEILSCGKNLEDNNNQEIKYACQFCEKSYHLKNSLLRHVRKKHMVNLEVTERNHQCEICARTFVRKGLLERHKETHFQRVAYQCEHCGDVFDRKRKLAYHVIKHDKQKKFQCDICQKYFLRNTTLKVHKKQHAKILPYPCPECDRAFSLRPALEAHIRTHSELRPYVCDICRRAFRHPNHLETHTKLHTGERPYSCTMCPKKFTTSTHLKHHIKVHLDQRDYKCEICGRAFIHSTELKYHRISHTHVKEHACPICKKLFARTNHVTKHLKQVHKLRKNYYAYD